MAIGVLMNFREGSNAAYDRVLERMGLSAGGTPPHCLYHIAGETDSGFRVVDVWDSPEAFERFAEEQLVPLAGAEGVPPPDVSVWEIHNTLRPGQEGIPALRRAYEAFARGDLARVFDAFDEQIDWYSPDELPIGGSFRGAAQLLGFFQRLGREYEELRVEPDEYVALPGSRVLVVGHHRGRLRGEAFEVRFAHLWTMRGGRAVRFEEYSDTGKLLPIFERQPG